MREKKLRRMLLEDSLKVMQVKMVLGQIRPR
jgi:hypothetical protein